MDSASITRTPSVPIFPEKTTRNLHRRLYNKVIARITVSVDIAAGVDAVWREASDLPAHADWMADAESIELLSDQRRGVGTRMKVASKLGPLRTSDVMEVVRWEENSLIGVRHVGLVTGIGEFAISPVAGGTRFTWTEDLRLPWRLGGPIGAYLAKPVLRALWRGNLTRLKKRVESASALSGK